MTKPMAFPPRAFFQPGFMPDVQAELRSRGASVVELWTPANAPADVVRSEMERTGFADGDMIAGLPFYVEIGLRAMRIPARNRPTIPISLRTSFAVGYGSPPSAAWRTTSRRGGTRRSSSSPRARAGPRSSRGRVLHGPVDGCLSGEYGLLNPEINPLVAKAGGREAPVLCGEVLDMNSEYAVCVIDGEIRGVCHYMCKRSTCRCASGEPAAAGMPVLGLDMGVVDEAV